LVVISNYIQFGYRCLIHVKFSTNLYPECNFIVNLKKAKIDLLFYFENDFLSARFQKTSL